MTIITKEDITKEVIAMIASARGEVYEPGDKQIEAAAESIIDRVIEWKDALNAGTQKTE